MSTPTTESTYAIGPYRLIGKIGEGGMGVVYLAHGPDDRRVAVKVLRPYIVGDAHGRSRLAREVTSLRRVRSPRIAEVYDSDPWGETPYVVTRYVPGPSLREIVDQQGPMTGPGLLRLARGLAEALVVVHRADVLHRDVKPSNVLVENGDPVLIDFGLAQLSDDMTLTQTGWLLGTPGYLAPEILYGDTPAPAADVHAWAATVVFAATGRGPYGSGPPMAIMDRARRGESDLSGVPADLVGILAAALRPDPANRPTARQLVDWLADRPVLAQQAGATQVQAQLPPALVHAPVDEIPIESSRFRHATFWLAILCMTVAGTIAAPVVTVGWLICACWGLRTTALADRSAHARRMKRGPRSFDSAMGVALIPWYAARTLIASLVGGVVLLLGVAGFLALARFGPQPVELPALAVGGLSAGLVAWFGPLSRDVRRSGRIITTNLPRSGLAAAVVVLLVLGVACGLLAVQQITGTTYLPFTP